MLQLPFLYDGVHHRASTASGQGARFFVQGSAAPLLGLAAVSPSTAFVNIETQEPWRGHSKYMLSCIFAKEAKVEAFAYSSFFGEGELLVAVKLQPEIDDFMILLVDLKSSILSTASCRQLFDARSSLQPGSTDYHVVASNLLPHQKLNVELSINDSELCFCIEHVEILWDDCQCQSLETFMKKRPHLAWQEKVVAALTGRVDAFPGLEPCQVQHAMLVQQRRPQHALHLSFVVFFRYGRAMGKLWSCRARHLYKQSEAVTLISDLKVGDQVSGILYAEWRQVGSGMHHVLAVTSKLAKGEPLLAVQLGAVADAVSMDLGSYNEKYWADLWKLEDPKQDLTMRCYWQAYRCDCAEVQVIDDDEEEGDGTLDVGKLVETTFRQLEGFVAHKVKSEVLKERINEKRAPTATTGTKKRKQAPEKQVDCCFVDPYADICKAQRAALTSGQEALASTPADIATIESEVQSSKANTVARAVEQDGSTYNTNGENGGYKKDSTWEPWEWKQYNSWEGKKKWRNNTDWKEDRHESHLRKRGTMPPPPPPRRLEDVEHGQPLQPFFGGDSLHVGLRPLKFFRRILEKESICFIGREDDFKVHEG